MDKTSYEKKIKLVKIRSYQHANGFTRNKTAVFTTKEYKQFQRDVRLQLGMHEIAGNSPLYLQFEFIFNVPSSLSENKKKPLYGQYYNKQRDLDNLEKGLTDIIAKQFNFNDKNICVKYSTKRYKTIEESSEDNLEWVNIKIRQLN